MDWVILDVCIMMVQLAIPFGLVMFVVVDTIYFA